MSAVAHRYPTYKRVTSAIVLILAALWLGYLLLAPNPGAHNPGAGIPIGAKAPDFELQTIDGQTYRLSDLKGKAVMINFWASWCPPCRSEMPALQSVYAKYKDQGFVILAVNLNESDLAIRNFREDFGLTFPIVVDKEDRVSRLYDIVPLPTSYFVDREGVVQGLWKGPIGEPELEMMLKKIM